MKQKITYNTLLIRYHKYKNKLQRLQAAGKNQHRQNVLKKHIERLQVKLTTLFSRIKRTTAMAAAVSGMLLLSANANAQEITFGGVRINPFIQQEGTITLETLSTVLSSPTFVDIDGDGDLDVFSGDYGDSVFYYFENTGDASNPSYASPQENPFGLIDTGSFSFPTFADIDGDGDFDIFVGGTADDGISSIFNYFENIGTATAPEFDAPQLEPFGINTGDYSVVPTFVDLDNDGDLDLVLGGSYEALIYYENNGEPIPTFSAPELNPFSLPTVPDFSIPVFGDFDNDGDFDLLLGSSSEGFFYYENTGNADDPEFLTVQNNPFNLEYINVGTPAVADLDNDGDLDVLSGSYGGAFFYFKNIGTAIIPDFEFQEPFNIGTGESAPALADIDNDGDFDLFMGGADGNFYYLENTGNNNTPIFTALDTNPFNLINIGEYNSAPTFVDIDDDGDLDMFSGALFSNFFYFENIGTASTPNFEAPITSPFNLTTASDAYAYPSFADMDNDGDLDLISGYYGGFVPGFDYFENTGTASMPDFAAPITNPFGLTGSGIEFSKPVLNDIDGDGDFDLLSGEYYGDFYYFENMGTPTLPNFIAPITNPFNLTNIGYYYYSTPTFADIDGDGDLDLFSGGEYGNFYFFENTSPLSITKANTNAVSLYPNPNTGIFTIQSKTPNLETLTLHDILGKHVLTQPLDSSQSTHTIDASTLSKGIYVLTLSGADTSVTKKLVIK